MVTGGLNIEKAALSSPVQHHLLQRQKVRAMMNLWIAQENRHWTTRCGVGGQKDRNSDDAYEIEQSRE